MSTEELSHYSDDLVGVDCVSHPVSSDASPPPPCDVPSVDEH